jgi:hypothetical protein
MEHYYGGASEFHYGSASSLLGAARSPKKR